MMSDPRNHHYVPQAYLLGFADKRQQVCVRWRMDDRPSFVTRVRNIASERDFYSFVNDKTGNVDHRSLETGLNMSEILWNYTDLCSSGSKHRPRHRRFRRS
jgi:hypothetical protein